MKAQLVKTPKGYALHITEHPLQHFKPACHPWRDGHMKLSLPNCERVHGGAVTLEMRSENLPKFDNYGCLILKS
jgi:hypothetical protein